MNRLALTSSSARHPQSFSYDHQVWFDGALYSDGSRVLNQPASEAKERAYFQRRIGRQLAKGRSHVHRKLRLSDLHKHASRQETRWFLRRLCKQSRHAGLALTEAT